MFSLSLSLSRKYSRKLGYDSHHGDTREIERRGSEGQHRAARGVPFPPELPPHPQPLSGRRCPSPPPPAPPSPRFRLRLQDVMRDRGDKLPGVGLPRHEQRPRGQGLQRAPWPKELAEAKVQIGRDLDLGARNHRPSRSSGHAESRAHRLVDEQQAPQRVPGVRVRSELPRGPAPARALVAGGEGAGRPVDVKVAERRRAPRAALEPEEDRLVAVRAGAAVILLVVGEEEPAPAAVGAAVGDVARGRDGREVGGGRVGGRGGRRRRRRPREQCCPSSGSGSRPRMLALFGVPLRVRA